MEDSESVLYKNAIRYLHVISAQVPNAQPLLKSFYTIKYRILEAKGQVVLPDNTKRNKVQCPRCCLKFSDTLATHFIKPEPKNRRLSSKIAKKISQNKELTPYQAKYLKRNGGLGQNCVVITCNFCKKTVFNTIHKRCKPKKVVCSPKKKNKKKAKKDKLCGLNAVAVSSVKNKQNHVATTSNFVPTTSTPVVTSVHKFKNQKSNNLLKIQSNALSKKKTKLLKNSKIKLSDILKNVGGRKKPSSNPLKNFLNAFI